MKFKYYKKIGTIVIITIVIILFSSIISFAGMTGIDECQYEAGNYRCSHVANMSSNTIFGQADVAHKQQWNLSTITIRINGEAWTYNNQVTGYYDKSDSEYNIRFSISDSSSYSGNGYSTKTNVWFCSYGPYPFEVFK